MKIMIWNWAWSELGCHITCYLLTSRVLGLIPCITFFGHSYHAVIIAKLHSSYYVVLTSDKHNEISQYHMLICMQDVTRA
jgi:hypothetical protein